VVAMKKFWQCVYSSKKKGGMLAVIYTAQVLNKKKTITKKKLVQKKLNSCKKKGGMLAVIYTAQVLNKSL